MRSRAYNLAHREEIKAYNRAYYLAHQEELKDKHQAYNRTYLKDPAQRTGHSLKEAQKGEV